MTYDDDDEKHHVHVVLLLSGCVHGAQEMNWVRKKRKGERQAILLYKKVCY